MKVKHINLLLIFLDYLMTPIMFIVGGLHRDSLQHTHFWHMQNEYVAHIDMSKGIVVNGVDTSQVKTKHILFHMPIFGGWKDYVILEIQRESPHWHIGWFMKDGRGLKNVQIQRLPLLSDKVRMLRGVRGTVTTFFAVEEPSPFLVRSRGCLQPVCLLA